MKKLVSIVLSVVFIAGGVAFIVLGIHQISTKDLYDSTVTATVVDVEENLDTITDPENAETNVTVYIDYEVDGVKYEHVEAPEYDSSMKVGDTMEILYQSKDPSKYSGQNIGQTAAIFIGLGAVLAIAGCAATVKAITKK